MQTETRGAPGFRASADSDEGLDGAEMVSIIIKRNNRKALTSRDGATCLAATASDDITSPSRRTAEP
jgi:hypothetical protein